MSATELQQKLRATAAAVSAAEAARTAISSRAQEHARQRKHKLERLTTLESRFREQRTAIALDEGVAGTQVDALELENLRTDIAVSDEVSDALDQRAAFADSQVASARNALKTATRAYIENEILEPARSRFKDLLEQIHEVGVDLMAANYLVHIKFREEGRYFTGDFYGPAHDLLEGMRGLRWYATPYSIEPKWLKRFRPNAPEGLDEKRQAILAKVEEALQ